MVLCKFPSLFLFWSDINFQLSYLLFTAEQKERWQISDLIRLQSLLWSTTFLTFECRDLAKKISEELSLDILPDNVANGF